MHASGLVGKRAERLLSGKGRRRGLPREIALHWVLLPGGYILIIEPIFIS